MIEKLKEKIMNISKDDKVLSTFVNDKSIDKIVRIRAVKEDKDKSDVFKEALIEYFEAHPLTDDEAAVLNE